MSDWMRLIERRMTTQERREPQFNIQRQLGPGFNRFARQVVDWNTENTWFSGHYWSDIDSVNSPDPAVQWIGITRSAAQEGGVQDVSSLDGTLRKTRAFTYNAGGIPVFSPWVDGPSGGSTGGPPTGAAGGDLDGFYPDPEIRLGAVGNAELANNSITSNKIVDGTITAADLAPGVIPDIDVYYFEQSIVVGTSHIVHTHGQGTKGLEVEFWDGGGVQRFGDVTKPDVNTVVVDFAFPLTGTLIVYGAVA